MARRIGWMMVAWAIALNPGCSCREGGQAADDLNLLVTPPSLDFGTVPIQTSATRTLVMRHVGTSGVIQIESVRIESRSTEFQVTEPGTTSLAPGEETTVTVTYSPLDSQDDGGTVVIRHNVPPLSETRIPITANGQFADLIAIPSPVDFGEVLAGDSLAQDVLLRNVGSDAVELRTIYLDPEGSPDIRLEAVVLPEGSVLPFRLEPNQEIGLVVRYEPKGGNDDLGRLVVEGESRGETGRWSYDLLGTELGPRLIAYPGVIDFGWVPLDETRTQLLMISNEGNADLRIQGIYVPPGGDATLRITDAPDQEVVVPTGRSVEYHVEWTADDPKPAGADPIGAIAVNSNDSTSPTLIPVFGRVDAPYLTVVPDVVDLGFAPQNQTSSRTVTLRNDGHGPLEISSITIEDISVTSHGAEWSFQMDSQYQSGSGWTLPGNSAAPLVVTFLNKGPAVGSDSAKLVITSNSPGNGRIAVPMNVTRSGSPECKVQLMPASLNFGTVAEGFYRELPINLVNVGSGPCSFKQARIEDCVGFAGMPVVCQAPGSVGPSSIFQFAGLPAATLNGIPQGASVPIRIRFIPRNVASVFGELTTYSALLWIKAYDANNKNDIVVPAGTGAGGATYNPNLTGTGGIARVKVIPDTMEFGLVTVGCWSKAQRACVYNTGSVALEVTDIKFQGCTPEFKKKNVPGLPKQVAPNVPFCFEVAYAPQDEGTDECVMQISSNDQSLPSLNVALSGTGTYETHQTDRFKQVSGQEVDILFVIDDSGSMCEEQDRLVSNFAEFIQQSTIWNNDYHIGVISTMVTNDNVKGRLNRGNKTITPRFITPNAQAQSQFQRLAKLGCDGGSDSQEAALQAAEAALSAPLISDTGIACTSDDQCRNDKSLCASPTGCPYLCVEGTCGGFNKSFLRKDAQLEIIVLSDEEDQSNGAPSYYIDFFKNIKGYYNVNMMHVNVIVGMPAKPGDQTCSSPDGSTSAEVGKRYLEVADQTGGKKGSICDPNFATVMNQIGAQAFGLKVQFYLSRLADPATVTVKVKGAACSSGWTYDAPSNSVIFDDQGPCMPQPGDDVVIDYETLCLTS